MNYWNENCPICGQNFTPEDDVVVCPDCGAPHHRACWKEKGSCAFADLHEGGYVWQGTQPSTPSQDAEPEKVMTCPRCGEPCTSDTLVCPTCGNRFGAAPSGTGYSYNENYFMRGIEGDPNEDLDGMTVREAAVFVQQRSAVYVRKFRKQKAKNQKVGWNWAAFLFSPFWFFYRKLYKAGLLFMGIWMVLSLFTPFIPGLSTMQEKAYKDLADVLPVFEQMQTNAESSTAELMEEYQKEINEAVENGKIRNVTVALMRYSALGLVSRLILFVPNIFAAVFADSIYKKKLSQDIKRIHEYPVDEQMFRYFAARRGGTSLFGLLGAVLIQEMFVSLVYTIL